MTSGVSGTTQSTAAETAGTQTTAKKNLSDKDMFLQLLVAQIKNQNPLNPADGTQFLSQLAQFSELEQMTQVRTGNRGAPRGLERRRRKRSRRRFRPRRTEMFTSFSTALSALSAHSTAVDVVGNNLANLNTPGYKTSVVYFRDLVTQSLGAGLGETQVGFGTGRPVHHPAVHARRDPGSTGLLDAAIQGDGFFVLRDAQGATLYTRAGNFQVDD